MAGMQPRDVYALTGVADPRLSPDGRRVAYVVKGIDGDANEYRGAIWLAGTSGAAGARQFTSGVKRDLEPRWSPDGTRLAFVSNRDGETMQLYAVPVEGGEARKLSALKEDVTGAVWSPDGRQIAFVARVPDAEYDEEDAKRRRPRRFSRLQYKLEHVGWTVDRPQHLFVVPADGSAEPRQLTSGDFEDVSPAWSPDGKTIAFVSARHPDWDVEPVTDVYLVDDGGGEPRRLTQGGGQFDLLSWSPEGTTIAGLRYPTVFDDPKHVQVALVEARTGEIRMLTESLDRNCGPYPSMREPIWVDGDLLFAVEDRGDLHLYVVAADGSGEPRRVVGGERQVTGYDAAGGVLVFAAGEPTALPELFVARDHVLGGNGGESAAAREVSDGGEAGEGGSGAERRLTDAGKAFAAGRELVPAERFTAVSADGTEVECWVMRPAGLEPGRRHPALLNIHGGPYGQYGNVFFDEFQVYAGGGYAVVFCNPRGSSGHDEAWARAIRGPGELGPGWGSVDYEDCMAATEEAVRRFDFIDGDRLGVIGGSYGGYMTSWIVSHTDRFKAAVSERSVNQFVSEWGSSDFGWDFKGYTGVYLFEDVDAYLKVSPATCAQDIHTPLLILHSEDDLRCPIEQAEQLFVTLRLLKRPVEFVRFPAESHELTRSGSPVHRVQRFEIVLEWFDRFLKA